MPTYISGPMTGKPDLNFPAFAAKATELRAAGIEVVNPAEITHIDGATWADYMRRDIVELMRCDAIHMLPGWGESKGARLEFWIAYQLGMRIEGALE